MVHSALYIKGAIEETTRGVFSSRPLKKGTVVLQVPTSYWLGMETFSVQEEVAMAGLNTVDKTAFTMLKRGGDARWQPWLASLPKSSPGWPVLWTQAQIDPLRDIDEEFYNSVMEFRMFAGSSYATVAPLLSQDVSKEDFFLSIHFVLSRVFNIQIKDQGTAEWDEQKGTLMPG